MGFFPAAFDAIGRSGVDVRAPTIYERIWNAGDLDAVVHLLTEDFLFRGSLGSEHRGRDGFADYVRSVRNAQLPVRVLECVTQDNRAFAKMRFSGVHTRDFRGYFADRAAGALARCCAYWLTRKTLSLSYGCWET